MTATLLAAVLSTPGYPSAVCADPPPVAPYAQPHYVAPQFYAAPTYAQPLYATPQYAAPQVYAADCAGAAAVYYRASSACDSSYGAYYRASSSCDSGAAAAGVRARVFAPRGVIRARLFGIRGGCG